MKSIFIEPLLSWETAAEQVTPDEVAQARAFGAEHRRREFLTWRAIVRRELGAQVHITYNAIGAPIVNREVHIGVSHCRDRVAVCISDAPCAVDIESADRNFGRVVSRYMTTEEGALCGDPRWPAVAWCTKETLYKFAAREGLDLRCDLHILSADLSAGWVTGSIENEEPVRLSVSFQDGCVAVYIL